MNDDKTMDDYNVNIYAGKGKNEGYNMDDKLMDDNKIMDDETADDQATELGSMIVLLSVLKKKKEGQSLGESLAEMLGIKRKDKKITMFEAGLKRLAAKEAAKQDGCSRICIRCRRENHDCPPDLDPGTRRICVRCRRIGHKTPDCTQQPQHDIDTDTLRALLSARKNGPLCIRCSKAWPDLIALLSAPTRSEGTRRRKSFRFGHDGRHHVLDAGFHMCCPLCILVFLHLPPFWFPPFQNPHRYWITLRQRLSTNVTHALDNETALQGWCLTPDAGRPKRQGLWSPRDGPIISSVEPHPDINYPVAYFTLANAADNLSILGGRAINSRKFSASVAKSWINRCHATHPNACSTIWAKDLGRVRLVDVTSRTIVQHPTEQVDYVALSYVWGSPSQHKRYQLGSHVDSPPKTIEDAIHVTKELGKKFLWVDSTCIDQGDGADKQEQLQLMADIYSGAWVTIIALDGDCSDSGLPRSGASVESAPGHFDKYAWTCTHNGNTLVANRPTLRGKLQRSTWATRGWTLQEAVLAPRRLYFTQEQTYYECNLLQACESLDDSISPHYCRHEGDLLQGKVKDLQASFSDGVLSGAFLSLGGSLDTDKTADHGLASYKRLLMVYARRNLSVDADALNAFSAILKRLESYLPHGFLWGIPRHRFHQFLLWRPEPECHANQLRAQFPSWSWVRWKSPLDEYIPGGEIVESVYCQFYTIRQGSQVPVCPTPAKQFTPGLDEHPFSPDGKLTTHYKRHGQPEPDLSAMKDDDKVLLVDGILLTVDLPPLKDDIGKRSNGFITWFDTETLPSSSDGSRGYDCLLLAHYLNPEVDRNDDGKLDTEIRSWFLMLGWDNGIAHRVGTAVFSWNGEADGVTIPSMWAECSPRLATFLLA
ncbi:heterokaryon incompatibility protein-domain-containing protein [Podospora aff. communis PSN243]|uniref:Heterokaryon incompatibility protein-domain-containing protein n=1 Tax=Podospora aff. communis PSN243 TaxID=3040156 RepID=A0AAV9H628_9PEZI|nr:heterokaryon incompatibility protein-domain-containing protein [Podospora aff. communis PSN243]